MTDITMYDSIDLSQIPADAAAVAGYVGGNWPTFAKLAGQFPHAHRLSIAVNAGEDAACLDIEQGDATVDQAAAWVKRQQAHGGVARPVLYTSLSQAAAVLDALADAGIARADVRLWTAHYTGAPHRCTGACGSGFSDTADATQYTNQALNKNLDASLVADTFFPAAAPTHSPPPAGPEPSHIGP
jgi:hypothetical protein